MRTDFAHALAVQRSIVGLCPWCTTFFRLSECRFIFKNGRKDWLDRMYDLEARLEQSEARLDERERAIRESAREKGRARARRAIAKVDPIFARRGLSAEDAKPLFHPVQFAVFDGLADTDAVSRLYLLDRKRARDRALQRSIEKCISRGSYEWRTFRVGSDGAVTEE